jgi:GT2 family glycosyltransferase
MPDAILTAVINWNGWRDTVVCVESMRSLRGPPIDLLICDNGSTDDSYPRLCEWVVDALGTSGGIRSQVRDGELMTFATEAGRDTSALRSVRVMRLSQNFGYAGAINRAITWGCEALDPSCFWLLNNDVALDPGALEYLVACARSSASIGLCGSVLLEWDEPNVIQAVGGIFHKAIGIGSHLKRLPARGNDGNVCFDIDYPVGASLLVTREFIASVGLMDEGYFLYFEEVDWAVRGRQHGFRPAVALRSRVRHKEGASTGSSGVRGKSLLSEHYGVVNRLRFTAKFSPWLLPVVWLSLVLVIADRVAHREWKRAALILRLMFRSVSRDVP